ncbi:MAG: hypothetical protein WED04_02130 [Promethearchaeati archaeon SRVP18_Atabeyarchaeia-1]
MAGIISRSFLAEMIAGRNFSSNVKLLFLIKDWNDLMGIDSRKWLYRGREIEKIVRNWVIMLVSSIHVVGTSPEDVHLLVVGPGVFHSTFRVGGGLVLDCREVSGIVISPHLLDVISSARKEYDGVTDLIVNEHAVEIPFSIIDKPSSIQEYDRGVLAVKVFTAFKDAFKELEEHCSDPNTYSTEQGLKILSSHPEFANRILVGNELGEWAKRKVAKYVDPPDTIRLATEAREYMMDLPGIILSQPGTDEVFLTRFLMQGLAGGYSTGDPQLLRTIRETKEYVLGKEIPQIKESYARIKPLIAGGLY